MDVELLVIAQCPHTNDAQQLLRTALDDVGLVETPITTTVIETLDQARARKFPGSPTLRADGFDLFPQPTHPPAALACRIYAAAAGGSSGVPELRSLRQALQDAAGRRRP